NSAGTGNKSSAKKAPVSKTKTVKNELNPSSGSRKYPVNGQKKPNSKKDFFEEEDGDILLKD
ncbi:MAG: hypothetical protein Q4F11_10570, partial [Eubacteriales bacterium]|nr:hypothetical protein [Eubacteriales bacterium]